MKQGTLPVESLASTIALWISSSCHLLNTSALAL